MVPKQEPLIRVSRLHFARVDDEYYVTPEDQDLVACLNPPGFVVLAGLNGSTTIETLVQRLTQRSLWRKWVLLFKRLFRSGPLTWEFRSHKGVCAEVVRPKVERITKQLAELGLALPRAEVPQPEPDQQESSILDFLGSPELIKSWSGEELIGGLLVDIPRAGIRVIVPEDPAPTTCPPTICTVPAGLYGEGVLIRTF